MAVVLLVVLGIVIRVKAEQQASANPSSTPEKSKKKLGIGVTPVDVEAAHRNQSNAQPVNVESSHKYKRGEFLIAPILMREECIRTLLSKSGDAHG